MRFSLLVAAAAAPLLAHAAPILKPRVDSDIVVTVLKFAEILEKLETTFYSQALDKFTTQDFIDAGISVPDVAIQTFTDIQTHEANHVAILDQALSDNGDTPISGCSFDFSPVLTDVATMASVARVVEHVGVAAYLGGADLLDDKNFLAAAATILTVEARHQTFLNIINGATAIPQAFDVALTPADVLSIAGSFITGCDVASELGLTSNAPLGISNQGPVTAGTLLQFSSPALNSTTQGSAFCQMLIGGQTTSLPFPIEQCVVPQGINGPVWIWLTTDGQPLAADIHVRASSSILAGPIAAFIDSESDALGALVRTGGSSFNSTQTISPSDAQGQLISATTELQATPTSGSPSTPENVAPIVPLGTTIADASLASSVTVAPALATAPAEAPIAVLGFSSVTMSTAA